MPGRRNLTITEAAELTGLSRKAMARRVERGSVRSVLRAGRRLIPRSELVRAGLLPPEGDYGARGGGGVDPLEHPAVTSEESGGEPSLLAALVRELLDRVQQQAGELAQHRALTAEAESLRLQREVADLRARLSALEVGASQSALESGPRAAALSFAAPEERSEARPRPRPSDERLWLPPSVSPRTEPAAARTSFRPAPRTGQPSPRFGSRALPLLGEMLFILAVATAAWRADVGPLLAAGAVGLAWVLASGVELVRWRSRRAR